MQTVNVIIDAEGNVKVDAQGVQGTGCQALTKAIEDSLGRVTADQKKPEYFQQQTNHARASTGHHG
jgi:alcohol dehydrogenase class IV